MSAEPTQGRRVEWPEGLLAPGEYAKHPTAGWHGMTPNGHLANLSAHDVTEHEDGTITVSPSILVSRRTSPETWSHTRSGPEYPVRGEEMWHGFLERGAWRAC